MSKTLRYVLIAVGVLVLLLVALPFMIDVNSFRPTIEANLSEALGRQVHVGNMGLSIFAGSLSADDLSIADDPKFSSKPFLSAKTFKIGVEVWPLITSKVINVTGLTIEKPELNLIRNQQGAWNFSSLGGTSGAPQAGVKGGAPQAGAKGGAQAVPDFKVAKLELKDGRAIIAMTGSPKQSVYENVNLTASEVSMKSQFPVQVSADLPGGGNFNLDGKIGPLNTTDATLTPMDAKVTIKGLDLAKSGFVDPSSGISGVVDVTNTLVSRDGTAHAVGGAQATRLQLVKSGAPSAIPLNTEFDITYTLANSAGTINHGTVTVGKATAHQSGTFQQKGPDLVLNIKVDGQNLPVTDLEAFLPAIGVILPKGSSLKSGTLSGNLAIQGPVGRLVIAGPVGLFNAQLNNFDINSKMAEISKFTGGHSANDTTIQKFTSSVRVAPEGIQLNAIDGVVASIGSVTGAGTISPSDALNFNMIALISSAGAVNTVTSIVPGMKSASVGGPIKVPFTIHGTTSDPKFTADTSAVAKEAAAGLAQHELNGALSKSGIPPSAVDSLTGLLGGHKKK